MQLETSTSVELAGTVPPKGEHSSFRNGYETAELTEAGALLGHR
jgi:hypothetical protein